MDNRHFHIFLHFQWKFLMQISMEFFEKSVMAEQWLIFQCVGQIDRKFLGNVNKFFIRCRFSILLNFLARIENSLLFYSHNWFPFEFEPERNLHQFISTYHSQIHCIELKNLLSSRFFPFDCCRIKATLFLSEDYVQVKHQNSFKACTYVYGHKLTGQNIH